MENHSRKTQEPTQISKLIGDAEILGEKPDLPRKPPQYDLLKASNPNHHLVVRYHEEQKKYNEYWLKAMPPKTVEPKPELKKLVQVDFVYLYGLFKTAYTLANGTDFNPNHNDGEPKVFVFTLLYYLFRCDNFYSSPLLNNAVSIPSLDKGILVMGWYGCGKTSIFKALKHLFFEASRDEALMIKDVDGDMVPLKRYRKLFFAFFSVNEVVKDYEGCSTQEGKNRFWDIMSKGRHYYDDLTKEREASNYGKVELFQDILESRYDKKVITMASLNYCKGSDESLAASTLKAMGVKYGPRIYDRAFEMFNIIELQGKSLRK